MKRVDAGLLPVDHPLLLLLAEPRRARFTVGDGIWVRLVDVEAALAARSYKDGDPVVLEVRDVFCPWNDGCHSVGQGRTDAEPHLRLERLGTWVGLLGRHYLRAGRAGAARGGAARGRRRSGGRTLPNRPGAVCPEIF